MGMTASKARQVLSLVGVALLLLCCGKCGLEVLPPVTEEALCGTFESEDGAVVVLERGGKSYAEGVAWGDEGDGQVTGWGSWGIERDFLSPWEVTFVVEQTGFTLTVERSWRGELSLWHYLGDPDSFNKQTFLRKSGCA